MTRFKLILNHFFVKEIIFFLIQVNYKKFEKFLVISSKMFCVEQCGVVV